MLFKSMSLGKITKEEKEKRTKKWDIGSQYLELKEVRRNQKRDWEEHPREMGVKPRSMMLENQEKSFNVERVITYTKCFQYIK